MVDPESVLARSADGPDIVLRYADHEDGIADVWLAPAVADDAPAPLLYALHGGFWKQQYDRRHLRPLAYALANLGWMVVVPEYARVGGSRADGAAGGAWPLLTADLRAVRQRVPELLGEVLPGRVGAERLVVVGHSAGGQLALWWALDSDAADCPRSVLALAPVADLARAQAEKLGGGAVRALFAGAPPTAVPPTAVPPNAVPPNDADPAARLRAGEAPDCALVVVHGELDQEIPAAHSAALGADVAAVDVRLLPDVEHYGLIDPLSSAWPSVRAALPSLQHPTTPTPQAPAAPGFLRRRLGG